MRRLVLVAMIALIGVLPLSVQAQTQPQPTPVSQGPGVLYPIALGLGAIVGVIAYNVAAGGVATVPFVTSVAPVAQVSAADAALATNRLMTVTAAVVGAWVANWLYGP
ncbi:MAG: hypothetical protein GC191_10235 [Azospirillum sp.]|nr:hypothetical protein [Azospirillum sp.]